MFADLGLKDAYKLFTRAQIGFHVYTLLKNRKLKQREIATLVPEQARSRELCDRVARAFASRGIEVRDILQTLPATRERVFARHYPNLTAQQSTRKRPARK